MYGSEYYFKESAETPFDLITIINAFLYSPPYIAKSSPLFRKPASKKKWVECRLPRSIPETNTPISGLGPWTQESVRVMGRGSLVSSKWDKYEILHH